ncbi:helix-turn-helix domain-containing protein [Streptomyces phytophilus]|uniref:helix-turn-helix domain-containing protein n=1 Tax=Streptomyces phytophilus TaxID=722715 RepID=UPI00215D7337|nr:helix-turn-helix domain-containing protein [Streptomyces phytophilus]
MSERRRSLGYSQEDLAERVGVALSTVQRWESGESNPQPWQRPKLARALDVTATRLSDLLSPSPADWAAPAPETPDDETSAWELARRVNASDVGGETLTRLERAFDDLATAYPMTPPQVLLRRVRKHTAYVAQLLDKRATLAEHRRLLSVGGWLSLLGATVHVDLDQQDAATAHMRTAATLAREADHREIEAWCYETDAWRVLTAGDYARALELSRAAQSLAPPGTSALIQATAQEGRALARLGENRETYAAIERVQQLSAAMGLAERPKEHHYQYDPAKALAYKATTLAWLGDPAAEAYAREVIVRLSPSADVQQWPRRVASANIDLALVLLSDGRLDEACDAARLAILSGRIVPSNHWRALEVVNAAESRTMPEAVDLREAYEGMKALSAPQG